MDKYTLYNFYIFFIKGLSQMLMTYRDRAISYKLWVAVNDAPRQSKMKITNKKGVLPDPY